MGCVVKAGDGLLRRNGSEVSRLGTGERLRLQIPAILRASYGPFGRARDRAPDLGESGGVQRKKLVVIGTDVAWVVCRRHLS